MKGRGLYSCSGTASSPLLSSTCCSWHVRCTLNVVSPLSLPVSGFACLHQAVSVNQISRLSWGRGAGVRLGRCCSPWHHGWWWNLSRYLRWPSLCFAQQWCWQWQAIHRGLPSLNATSSAIWDGLRIWDTYTELLEGPTEAPPPFHKSSSWLGKITWSFWLSTSVRHLAWLHTLQ